MPSLLRLLFSKRPAAPAAATLFLDGAPIAVTRKPIRILRLMLTPDGGLRVSAPSRTTDAAILAFVRSKSAWIRKQQAHLAEQAAEARRSEAILAALSPAERRTRDRAQRRALLVAAEAALPRWEAAMGLKASGLGVRAMRSRWGSCNTRTGKITLSLALAAQPPECLDYILVHELAHLQVRGHDRHFKALLTKHLPDWKQRQRQLSGKTAPL